ncbi:MAG: hypothetical protein P4M14_09105 [Gammaproteobacteria bacterium]|nr:hypothetical protein [Gammaproteobacteria bacterium]
MKLQLNKLTLLMAITAISGSVYAMDSTFVLPANGQGNSIQANPQVTMVKGYTKLYTNYADYSQTPTGMNSMPSNPAACALSDTVVNFAYGPASGISPTCTSYSCDTSCSWYDVGCWGEVAACETCIGTGVCNVFSCSCPRNQCNATSYAWNGNFNGPTVLTSITCGTAGFVTDAVQKQQAAQVAAAQAAGLQVAKNQINGLITQLNNITQSVSGGNGASIVASTAVSLANATANAAAVAAQAVIDAANAVASALSSAGSAISDAFSGGGW